MHILLLGKTGQLGWELHRALAPLGELSSLDYPEIDLAKPDDLCSAIQLQKPQVLINATAYTQVDRAESEPDIAMQVNASAPGALAECARSIGAVFIHYSTDYVFDGAKGSPYREDDPPNPLSVYGRSKLAGEQAVAALDGSYLILRTSWVYSLRRESFVNKVLGWARQHPVMRVVADQIGSPTWARMLAEATAMLLAQGSPHIQGWVRERRGLYHLAGSGAASRFEWARAILDQDPDRNSQICRELLPAKTSDFPTPAARPLYSALDCSRFTAVFGLQLPPWQAALHLAMNPN
jgi:dTDP-4-dehydrorhamnose reductase